MWDTKGKKTQLTEDALRRITEPERYEPLGMLVSDGYTALARTANRDLIAALPDVLLDSPEFFRGDGPVTLGDVRNWPVFHLTMRIVDRNGWMIVTPPFPSEARKYRVDRALLRRLVRRIAQKGANHIEDAAAFAANGSESPLYHFAGDYLRMVSNDAFNSGGIGNWSLLAVYGSLTADQQRAPAAGQPLTYRDLTDRQRRFVLQAVFGAT